MSICIFPGTFNPIHYAHIRMAEYALNFLGFEKIIFIPSYIPPQKNIDKTLAMHRLEMVKLATKHNPKFLISDIEYNNNSKSYSIITVKKIIEEYNLKGKVNFLIGTDAFENIDTWYKVNELKQLVHFIVFDRGIKLSEKKDFDFETVDLKFLDISSTKIRNNKKSDIKIVDEYIKRNKLYNE